VIAIGHFAGDFCYIFCLSDVAAQVELLVTIEARKLRAQKRWHSRSSLQEGKVLDTESKTRNPASVEKKRGRPQADLSGNDRGTNLRS